MRINNVRLAVFDLDGTLLNDKGEISTSTICSLHKLRAKGIKICIASGRHRFMIEHLQDLIDLTDYYISSNGAILTDSHMNLISGDLISFETTKIITEYLDRMHIDYVVYALKNVFFREDGDLIKAKFQKQIDLLESLNLNTSTVFEDSIENLRHLAIEKIVLYRALKEEIKMIDEMIMEVASDIDIQKTGDSFHSILNHDGSKGSRVIKLMGLLKIDATSIVVFGDYDNDISMFQVADHRIAPSNAVDTIKKLATHITSSNNDDGVSKFINEFMI